MTAPRGSGKPLHEVLADAFVAAGTTCVFGLMGDGNKRWLVDMAERGVTLVHARHEGASCAMADGFARASGTVGVCAVTYGPGATQLSTSLQVAAKHGTPLVVFAADVERAMLGSGGHLDVDERAVLGAAGAEVIEVRQPERAASQVATAFHIAATAGKPVAVLVAVDLQDELVVPMVETVDQASSVPKRALSTPDDTSLAQAAALLAEAHRPVVLAGAGAAAAGARGAVIDLADCLGAAITTTFGAKGWLDDHPRHVGLAGGFALPETYSVVAAADAVVAVGASLNDHTTDRGRLFATTPLVRIDCDPTVLAHRPHPPSQVGLCGDAGTSCSALAARYRELRRPRPARWWTALDDPRLAALDRHRVEVAPGTVDPRRLLLEVDRVLPEDAVVVIGGGHFMGFAAQFLTNRCGRRRFHLVFDFMCTGQAVPAAIGAAVACPDRLVVAVEGDASFLMHVQELETAARSGVGLLVLVLNDQALGAEYHSLAAAGCDPRHALAPTPDLGAVATALGGSGRRLDNLDDVDGILRWYVPGRGPYVVDCAVSRRVVGPR